MIKEIENWVIGNCPTSLQKIRQKHINISIYDRDITHLSHEVKSLLARNAEIRISGDIDKIVQTIENDLKQFAQLKNDLLTQLNLFKDITKANSFRVLLAAVNTNMCRKFHTPINDLRMLCTYSGPGTLWLEDDNVNRKALDTCGDNECIVLDETKIHQTKTGSVVILKGAIYPIEGTKAIVHRSPTIEEIGERRLLLRIDTNEFLNF
ncbi:MAG: DUF1826 domain-containing protein [Bacteroidetes bacterium]|nr:DUF1826 domain-containing protein [Bacteroidota bacterium]